MNLLEFVLLASWYLKDNHPNDISGNSLENIEVLLKELVEPDNAVSASSIGRVVIKNFHNGRLRNLRDRIKYFNHEAGPMIYGLLHSEKIIDDAIFV